MPCALLVPNQMRYQTALRPEGCFLRFFDRLSNPH